MKNKDKKTPKSNEEYILSTDAEAILYGLILVLVSIIGFLNYGVVGEALTYIFAYVFGIFYVFIYLFLIFLGIYLMIKKKFFKFKIDLKILGVILLVLGFSIASSSKHGLDISTFFPTYQNQINNAQKYIFAMNGTDAIYTNLGGGIIGYFLAGLLNTAITETGTMIVVAVFIILGLILLFKTLFVKFISFVVNYHKKRKLLRQQNLINEENNKNDEVVEEKVEENVEEIIEEVKEENSYTPPLRESASSIINRLANDEIEEEVIIEEIKENPLLIEDEIEEINDNSVIEEIITTDEELITIPVIETKSDNQFILPSISLLKEHLNNDESERKKLLADERLQKINACFSDLGIGATAISYTIGPSVTRFDIKMNPNVKTNVLCSIENDLAVRLGGNKTVRLETIVEGKDTSGIEIGNEISDIVSFKECIKELERNKKDRLIFPLGKNISGDIISCKLDDMPHLLVCGTTGSGKSVFVHNILVSLIMRNTPEQVRLMLIDPKVVEFAKYQDIPHLICPIINATDKAKIALTKLIEEMERRYALFAKYGKGATNLKEYLEVCEEMNYEKLPYIVMVCDEFADFMECDKENGKLIQRLAQKARACGIHMVIATQRPSVKVITGDIKANIPSRIALMVSSQVDSRTIIDEQGAENLLGRGDLLAKIPTYKSIIRVQSAYLDNREIYEICEFWRQQKEVIYDSNFDLTTKVITPFGMEESGLGGDQSSLYRDYHNDEKFEEIKRFVIATGKCSTTKLQNTFGIGFSRADGILDTLEQDGIIRKEGNRRVLSNEYQINDEEE